MNIFFYWEWKCFVLKIFRFVCFQWIHKLQHLWHHPRHSCTLEVPFSILSFRILGIISMTFDQKLVHLMTNISNLCLALLWRLETSFRFFYDFDKIAIKCNMFILSRWYLIFFKQNMLHEVWNISRKIFKNCIHDL